MTSVNESEEEGELLPNVAHRAKTNTSEEEFSDSERFDSPGKSDELAITSSIACYINKFFNTYLSETVVKDKVLDETPIPVNQVFTTPSVNELVEELIGSRKA